MSTVASPQPIKDGLQGPEGAPEQLDRSSEADQQDLGRAPDDQDQAPAEPAEPIAEPPADVRRSLKVVLSLQPGPGQGYRALLAVGAEGCDPALHSTEVADLSQVLAQVPHLLAQAEARWATQPRYPAAATTTKPAPVHRAAASRRAPAPVESQPAASPETPTEPEPETGSRDQLSLFG